MKPDANILPPFVPIEHWANISGVRDEFLRHIRTEVTIEPVAPLVVSLMYMTESPTKWLVAFLRKAGLPPARREELCLLWSDIAEHAFANAWTILDRDGGISALFHEKPSPNLVLRLNMLLRDVDAKSQALGKPTLRERILHYYGLKEFIPPIQYAG